MGGKELWEEEEEVQGRGDLEMARRSNDYLKI